MVDAPGPREVTDAPLTPTLLSVPGGAPDMDAPIRDAMHAHGAPVRLRMHPGVLVEGDYRGLPGTRWILDLPGEHETRGFLDDLDVFIRGWVRGKQIDGGAR